jgi:hypothetical protein
VSNWYPSYSCHSRLVWPEGHRRTPAVNRKNSAFRSGGSPIKMPAATTRLLQELSAFTPVGKPHRVDQVEITADHQVGRSGEFLTDAGKGFGADPGVAVYFTLDGKPMVFACDTWTAAAGNLAAIAAHLEAMRGMARWGVGTEEQLFTGYAALPPPMQWWDVIGVARDASIDEITRAYRDRARRLHPDVGGSNDDMAALNGAYAKALEERK